jgi:hypothetical protein
MDDRELAKGLALLVDNVTLVVVADWRHLLRAEADLYSAAGQRILGRMSTNEWLIMDASDPREMSDTAGEPDRAHLARYSVIGRLLERCARDGVDRAVAATAPPRDQPPA